MDYPQIETRPVDTLRPYKGNARTHSKKQIKQIAASIQQFGFTNPVLISDDDEIIAGHGRVLAARELGMREVPTLRLSHLSPEQRRAYVVADNKLALNAGSATWAGRRHRGSDLTSYAAVCPIAYRRGRLAAFQSQFPERSSGEWRSSQRGAVPRPDRQRFGLASGLRGNGTEKLTMYS